MNHRVRSLGTLIAALVSSMAAAEGDDPPAAVPYRPTVSTPAALSAPGYLEGEFGGLYLRDRHDDAATPRRASVPYTLKLAFTDDWGVRVGGEAFVHAAHNDASTVTGAGDTAIVVKRRFAVDPSSALGLEGGLDFATGRHGRGTGSGGRDWSLNGIYSADLGAFHSDVNLVATRLGTIGTGQSRLQSLGALAVSHPLDDRWTVAGEWSGTRQHGASSTAQGLVALSCAARRDFVVDFGIAHGSNRATPTWLAFTGITVVLGRIH